MTIFFRSIWFILSVFLLTGFTQIDPIGGGDGGGRPIDPPIDTGDGSDPGKIDPPIIVDTGNGGGIVPPDKEPPIDTNRGGGGDTIIVDPPIIIDTTGNGGGINPPKDTTGGRDTTGGSNNTSVNPKLNKIVSLNANGMVIQSNETVSLKIYSMSGRMLLEIISIRTLSWAELRGFGLRPGIYSFHFIVRGATHRVVWNVD